MRRVTLGQTGDARPRDLLPRLRLRLAWQPGAGGERLARAGRRLRAGGNLARSRAGLWRAAPPRPSRRNSSRGGATARGSAPRWGSRRRTRGAGSPRRWRRWRGARSPWCRDCAARSAARGRTSNTKLPLTAELVTASLEASLRRLGTDHVDLYALHNAEPAEIAREELLRALEDILAAGKARALAVAGSPEVAAGGDRPRRAVLGRPDRATGARRPGSRCCRRRGRRGSDR